MSTEPPIFKLMPELWLMVADYVESDHSSTVLLAQLCKRTRQIFRRRVWKNLKISFMSPRLTSQPVIRKMLVPEYERARRQEKRTKGYEEVIWYINKDNVKHWCDMLTNNQLGDFLQYIECVELRESVLEGTALASRLNVETFATLLADNLVKVGSVKVVHYLEHGFGQVQPKLMNTQTLGACLASNLKLKADGPNGDTINFDYQLATHPHGILPQDSNQLVQYLSAVHVVLPSNPSKRYVRAPVSGAWYNSGQLSAVKVFKLGRQQWSHLLHIYQFTRPWNIEWLLPGLESADITFPVRTRPERVADLIPRNVSELRVTDLIHREVFQEEEDDDDDEEDDDDDEEMQEEEMQEEEIQEEETPEEVQEEELQEEMQESEPSEMVFRYTYRKVTKLTYVQEVMTSTGDDMTAMAESQFHTRNSVRACHFPNLRELDLHNIRACQEIALNDDGILVSLFAHTLKDCRLTKLSFYGHLDELLRIEGAIAVCSTVETLVIRHISHGVLNFRDDDLKVFKNLRHLEIECWDYLDLYWPIYNGVQLLTHFPYLKVSFVRTNLAREMIKRTWSLSNQHQGRYPRPRQRVQAETVIPVAVPDSHYVSLDSQRRICPRPDLSEIEVRAFELFKETFRVPYRGSMIGAKTYFHSSGPIRYRHSQIRPPYYSPRGPTI